MSFYIVDLWGYKMKLCKMGLHEMFNPCLFETIMKINFLTLFKVFAI